MAVSLTLHGSVYHHIVEKKTEFIIALSAGISALRIDTICGLIQIRYICILNFFNPI